MIYWRQSRARSRDHQRRERATHLDQTSTWRRHCLFLGTAGTKDVEQVAHTFSSLHRLQALGEAPDLERSALSVGLKHVEQAAHSFDNQYLKIAKWSQ